MNEKPLNCGYCLCKVIGDAVNFSPLSIKLNNDDAELIKAFAKKHSIESILGCVLENSDILFEKDLLKNEAQNIWFRQMKFDIMLDKISEELSQKKIKHIILKGKEIQRFYPQNIIRNSTDIDIYVNKNDISSAVAVMERLGFSFGRRFKEDEYKFIKEPRYNVEIHISLEGFNNKQKKILLSLCENALPVDKFRYRLTDSDCYIYTLFHLYKHFINSGVGVRMFLDLYLIKKHAVIDKDYVETILHKLGILEFSKVVDEINEILFNGKVADNELEEVIEFIFQSGVFGNVKTNYHLAHINNELKGLTRFQRFVQDYGVSYNAMKIRYPILEKAPFLYPFSFIHRLYYGMKYKKQAIKNNKDLRKSVSSERIQEYERIFKTAKILK